MSKSKGLLSKNFPVFLLAVVLAVVIYLIVRNLSVFGNILLVVIGFGAVVIVHEFGHFIAAKLAGIKVEAFSIFIPPTLLGVKKTEDGLCFRILPQFFPKENDESEEGRLSFTVGKKGSPGETEYRIGLIPFGGFVKMLGQEDVGSAEASDDPRSYANKSVGARMAVIAAGVIFNAISAVIIFMIVFLIGIKEIPPVVGGVVPNSPAARAGLRAGDEIVEISGKSKDLNFRSIMIAAALSGRDEKVALKVRHEDGSIEDFAIVAESMQTPMGGEELRLFGVAVPLSLIIAEVTDVNTLYKETGLLPGDRVIAVHGKDVETYWELERVVQNSLSSEIKILAERTTEPNKVELVESQVGLDLNFANSYEIKSESDLHHIYSMVPRLRITAVLGAPDQMGRDAEFRLKTGDIILAIGDVENPTYKELRDVIEEYEDKELPTKVLRVDTNGIENPLIVTIVPKRQRKEQRVIIGINVALDVEHPVVAKTITAEGGPAKLEIPRGATIVAVDGTGVSNFYDVAREIRRNVGKHITIDYRLDAEVAGDVVLNVVDDKRFITAKPILVLPFGVLQRLYKASGPIDAIGMGYRRTVGFILEAYLTLQRAISGLVSPKNFMGPVGIIATIYQIASKGLLIEYVGFLGLISAFITVFNSLPLLPFDGGYIVLLLIEKIKGSPVNERFQVAIAYAGWVLVGAFVLYVTFNDIVRNFFH